MTPPRPVAAVLLSLILPFALALPAGAADEPALRVETCTEVLKEVLAIPEQGIPPALLRDAQGVAIIPSVIKVGFVVGGRFGKGTVLVRREDGSWSPPVLIQLMGGSLGWQIGAQSTDVVLVFKSRKSVRGLLEGKFTLGADAGVAAGPVGRRAEAATDAQLRAEIYSYSRSRGLFAGVSLEGSVLQVDNAADMAYYGEAVTPEKIVAGQGITVPPSGRKLQDLLAAHAAE